MLACIIYKPQRQATLAVRIFQIFAEIKMSRNENWLFGRPFETVQIFYFFY